MQIRDNKLGNTNWSFVWSWLCRGYAAVEEVEVPYRDVEINLGMRILWDIG